MFQNPGSGVSEGRGGLVFHMALLNGTIPQRQLNGKFALKDAFTALFFLLSFTEQMTAKAKTNIIPLGSFMPIWAAVEQRFHQPLLLLMDECVAASSPELHLGSQVYPIVGNKG